MKPITIKSENPLTDRVIIVDFKKKMAWDVTSFHEKMLRADDRVPENSNLIAAINGRALLTLLSANKLWVACENKDSADVDLDEINWNLQFLINWEMNPDEDLFAAIESGVASLTIER